MDAWVLWMSARRGQTDIRLYKHYQLFQERRIRSTFLRSLPLLLYLFRFLSLILRVFFLFPLLLLWAEKRSQMDYKQGTRERNRGRGSMWNLFELSSGTILSFFVQVGTN